MGGEPREGEKREKKVKGWKRIKLSYIYALIQDKLTIMYCKHDPMQ